MSTFAERFDSFYTQLCHQRRYQDEAMNLELSLSKVTEQPDTEAQVVNSQTIEVNEDSGDTEL